MNTNKKNASQICQMAEQQLGTPNHEKSASDYRLFDKVNELKKRHSGNEMVEIVDNRDLKIPLLLELFGRKVTTNITQDPEYYSRYPEEWMEIANPTTKVLFLLSDDYWGKLWMWFLCQTLSIDYRAKMRDVFESYRLMNSTYFKENPDDTRSPGGQFYADEMDLGYVMGDKFLMSDFTDFLLLTLTVDVYSTPLEPVRVTTKIFW